MAATLCNDTSRCGLNARANCVEATADELGCSGWSEKNSCDPGESFSADIAGDCLDALDALVCYRVEDIVHGHDDAWPVSCMTVCN